MLYCRASKQREYLHSKESDLMIGGNLQAQNPEGKSNFPSLDLIFELTKERITSQTTQVNTLDGKANYLLASASALVSAALILQAVLIPLRSISQSVHSVQQSPYCPLPPDKLLQLLPMIILLIVYLMTMLTAFHAYRVRVYKQVPELDELYKTYLFKEEKTTKAEVFRAMLEAYKENNKTIRKKVFWINISFVILVSEVIALVIVLLIQTIC